MVSQGRMVAGKDQDILDPQGGSGKQVDRGIDVNAGGILFRVMAAEGVQPASLVVVLLNKQQKS